MDQPITPVDKIHKPAESSIVPQVCRPIRPCSDNGDPTNSDIPGEEITQSSTHGGDLSSIVNKFSHLSVGSHQETSIQLTDTFESVRSSNLHSSQTSKMNPQDLTVSSSSDLLLKYLALFTDEASMSLTPDPLRFNNPNASVRRPAHLSWMDDPLLFADMSQDKNLGDESLDKLDLSDDNTLMMDNPPTNETSVPKPKVTDATITKAQKMLEVLLASRHVQSQLGIGDAGTGTNPDLVRKNAMAKVVAASRRLQSQLGIYDPTPWPNPPVPSDPKVGLDLIQKRAVFLRATLDSCSNFAVDANRKSEDNQFLDVEILALIMKNSEGAKIDHEASSSRASEIQSEARGVQSHPDAMLIDSKVDENSPGAGKDDENIPKGHIDMFNKMKYATKKGEKAVPDEESALRNVESKEKSIPSIHDKGSAGVGQGKVLLPDLAESSLSRIMFAENTTSTSDNNTEHSNKHKKPWGAISVPDPLMMPFTFTRAICQQEDFRASPVLALRLIDTAPNILYPNIKRSELLLHLEVGLDGVEAICQGEVRMKESTYWKENVREMRVGKLGTLKSGEGGFSKEFMDREIENGKGQGWWIFFGVRFKQTDEENAIAQGGKWACWGFPMEACSQITIKDETATYGGGKNGEGVDVPKHEVNVNRIEFLSSVGGIATMDLWEGADEWKAGIWDKVKNSMAHNGLKASFLFAADATDKRRRRKNRSHRRNVKKVKGNPEP